MEKRVGEKKRPRRHSSEFKAAALEKRKGCGSVVALSRELKVHWRMLYRWKSEQEAAEAARLRSAPEQRVAALREEITALKIALADTGFEFSGAGEIYRSDRKGKQER